MPRVTLGLPKSSVWRLLREMPDAGLLSGVGNAPRYRIGTLLFEIGRLHRQNSTLISLVDPALAEICRETGHTGYLSMLDGTDVLELRIHPGRQALRVVTPLGMLTEAARRVAERVDDALWRSVPSELAA
jgi:IclR family transcriptional regulator, KDG regulon repressor